MKKEKYIYERKTKKGTPYFQVQITFKDEYGVYKTFYQSVDISAYENKSTALKYAKIVRDNALGKIHAGKLIISSPTVSQLVEKQYELIPVSYRTKAKYRTFYKRILQSFSPQSIYKITTAQLQEDINDYALAHTSNETSRYIHAWAKLYKTANMLGYDISDKTKLVITPKEKKPQQQKTVTISSSDFLVILNAFATYESSHPKIKHRARLIWYLLQIMAYTGMRPAEALALNASDISDGYISINKSVGSTNTKSLAIVKTKTPQSVRKIPVTDDLRPILRQLVSESFTTPLLSDYDGGLMDIVCVTHMVRRVSKLTGVKFNLYMLRHNVATGLITNNVNPRTVQDILGHASFAMSLDYARSTEKERLNALDNLYKKT